MAAPDSSRGRPRPARALRIRLKSAPQGLPPRALVARAFGTALRDLRTARGLSQEALAAAAGIDRTYPSLLERGLRTPTLTLVDRLARPLGVRTSELIDRFSSELEKLSTS